MPMYEFENAKGERTVFYYTVANYPKIGAIHIDENKVEWTRVFSVPNAVSDTKLDPNNMADFVNKTAQKKGTVGDLWDQSRELSEKRAKQSVDGVDPVKKKFFEDYKKKRNGLDHPDAKKKKTYEKNGLSISLE